MNKHLKKSLIKIVQGAIALISAIALALCLRIFVFASYKIPSPSMKPSILSGDYILVNKLVLGPRIFKNFDFLDSGKIETKRLWGLRDVKRNDVLVFNYPYSNCHKLEMNLNIYYIKRCIAIPGDSFYIDNGIYKVKNCPDSLGCYAYQQQLSKRSKKSFYKNVYRCFPRDKRYGWNIKNFGPLYIPRAHDSLSIDSKNIKLYQKLICYETDKTITIKGDTVFLDKIILTRYIFKQNYYFMSGDYVFDSKDSRYWGLLPEDHIVGKASIIWKSKDPDSGKYRFKRFFKAVE